MFRKYFTERKSPLVGFFFYSLILIPLIITSVLYVLYLGEKERPFKKTYFTETFSDIGENTWKLVDATYTSNETPQTHNITIKRQNYMAPHLNTSIEYTNSPEDSFVWKFSTKINKTSGNAMVLGSLKFPSSELSVVINENGNLGLSRNMFADAIYGNKFNKLTHGKWEVVTVYVDKENKEISLYLNNKIILTTTLIEETYPIREIWLGSVWIGGKENYTAAINVQYDSIIIGNEGLIPVPTFWEFIKYKTLQIFE